MEREYISIEDIIASAQSSTIDFLIKGRFLINSVRGEIANNGTSYYNLNLKCKMVNLSAKRFTSDQLEFGSLNVIYLVGNIIEIEGIYQYKWHSVKITSEKLIESVMEDLPLENYDNNGRNLHEEKLALLKNQSDKFDELIKLIKFGTTIQIKSYINDVIRPIFDVASNKKIKEFKKSIEKHINIWPEDRREEFWNEYSRSIGRYEAMQPAKWKKWGARLLKLISVLR